MDSLFEQDLDQLSRREFLEWTRRGLSGLFLLLLSDKLSGKEQVLPAAQAHNPGSEPAVDENWLASTATPRPSSTLRPSATSTARPGAKTPTPKVTSTPSATPTLYDPFGGVPAPNMDVPERGRVLDNTLSVYVRPSFSAKLVTMYWRDLVFPITGVTIGDAYPAYNRVWYLINNQGYAHSGKVQPVALRRNTPLKTVPEGGMLAEVTVPYTEALFDPNRPDKIAYRLYYSTVHWILSIVSDQKGGKWYHIQDDKLKIEYYVNAEHLRPIKPEELSPLSPNVPAKDKRLEVRLGTQALVAYEGSRPVFMTRIASGGRFIDGDYTTPVGRYMTNRKRPSRHMASEDLAAPSAYDLPGVPWVSYLTQSGISFHGTYWHNDFGKPRSHGCVNLSPQAALWVYRWSSPNVPYTEHTWDKDEGTRIDVVE